MEEARTIGLKELARALFLWAVRHDWWDDDGDPPDWGAAESAEIRGGFYAQARELIDLSEGREDDEGAGSSRQS